jgi:hypothetical protein
VEALQIVDREMTMYLIYYWLDIRALWASRAFYRSIPAFRFARCAVNSFLLLAFAGSFCLGSALAQEGLIAHLNFSNVDKNGAIDLSGNGNNGAIVPLGASSDAIQRNGAFIGSLLFARDNSDFVRIPASESLNSVRRGITVLALIYPTSIWRAPTFMERVSAAVASRLPVIPAIGLTSEMKSANSLKSGFSAIVQRQWRTVVHPDQYYLGYGVRNNVLYYKWHIGLTDGADISIYQLPPGQKQPLVDELVHLAGAYDGASGKMALYVNAELIGSLTRPGEIRLDNESMSRPVAIGGELNGPSVEKATREFEGYIYDVQIYDRALTDDDVRARYEEAKQSVHLVK